MFACVTVVGLFVRGVCWFDCLVTLWVAVLLVCLLFDVDCCVALICLLGCWFALGCLFHVVCCCLCGCKLFTNVICCGF